MGLRERKKQRTRELIAGAAWSLFAERGFDRVTVAEVARAADVSEATVFNYFPTKEDLVYGRMEAFEAELLQAIRTRPAGESVLEAFGRFVLQPRGYLAARDAHALATIARVITTSPALLAREHEVFARYTESLAGLLAEETAAAPGDVAPRVAADALIAVHRALVDYVRRQSLAGREITRLVRDFRAQGKRAIALLENGLGDYDVRD